MTVEVREHLAGVISLLPLRGFWEFNSGGQAWWQNPSPTEPSCTPWLSVEPKPHTRTLKMDLEGRGGVSLGFLIYSSS